MKHILRNILILISIAMASAVLAYEIYIAAVVWGILRSLG